MLEIVELAVRYGREPLEYPSFSLERGFVYCLSGGNGSGKTSLLDYLFGSEEPIFLRGRVLLEGNPIAIGPERHLGDFHFKLLPQRRPNAGTLSVKSLTDACSQLNMSLKRNQPKALWPLTQIPKEPRARKFSHLSGGEWKIALLGAYISNPALAGLVLDEPLANLALQAQSRMIDSLCAVAKNRNIPVMLTSVVGEIRWPLEEALAARRIMQLPSLKKASGATHSTI